MMTLAWIAASGALIAAVAGGCSDDAPRQHPGFNPHVTPAEIPADGGGYSRPCGGEKPGVCP